jgi:hypothetical protein
MNARESSLLAHSWLEYSLYVSKGLACLWILSVFETICSQYPTLFSQFSCCFTTNWQTSMCFIWTKSTLTQSQPPQYLQKTNAYWLLTVQYNTMLVSIDSLLSKRTIDLTQIEFNPKPHMLRSSSMVLRVWPSIHINQITQSTPRWSRNIFSEVWYHDIGKWTIFSRSDIMIYVQVLTYPGLFSLCFLLLLFNTQPINRLRFI